MILICKHCRTGKVNRPRGLCWNCYYTPGIKEQYPSTSKFAHRGPGNFFGRTTLPAEPTEALPGSEEKLEVLAERVRRKVALWHPQDAGPRRVESVEEVLRKRTASAV